MGVSTERVFDRAHKVFLIGESWLAWRNGKKRGNVQKALQDAGFHVENFAKAGLTLSNFWRTIHMSWQKWAQIRINDAMIIVIGFNQLSDGDLKTKDEAEVGNIVRHALKQSNHVILVVPNLPQFPYFIRQAEWYIQKGRDDLDEPDIGANALKRQDIYANRVQKLCRLFETLQDSNPALQILDMQSVLVPKDICEDDIHLSPQGAESTASAIASMLKVRRSRLVRWPCSIWKTILTILAFKALHVLYIHVLRKAWKPSIVNRK